LKPFGSGFSLLSVFLCLRLSCLLCWPNGRCATGIPGARPLPDAFMNNKDSVSFLPVGIAEANKLTELALV
jgi:hypothetical protein